MNKALEKILVDRYPSIFKKYGGDMRETAMHWGISIGPGWFKIVDTLCKQLSKFGDEVVAEQVKEKFGGLRFYINKVSEKNYVEINKYIEEAEIKSMETCETCGEPGRRKGTGWVKTICDRCDDQSNFMKALENEAVTYKVFPDHIELYNINGIAIYSVSFDHFMKRISSRFGIMGKDELEKYKNENVDGKSGNSM